MKHKCEFCEKVGEDVVRREDPFMSELYNDDSKHWICDNCFRECLEDI